MIDATEPSLYTLGHSDHPVDLFLGLLARHRIDAVADVRSVPFSRRNPHFSRDSLRSSLAARAIGYVHLGAELGGRSDDPRCYENGQVQYDRVARTRSFLRGVERLEQAIGKQRVAVMCAEGEPLHCHRTLLVAPAMQQRGHEVAHILRDGSVEAHEAAMDRLLGELGLRLSGTLAVASRAELVAEAVALRARRIAYRARDVATAGGSR